MFHFLFILNIYSLVSIFINKQINYLFGVYLINHTRINCTKHLNRAKQIVQAIYFFIDIIYNMYIRTKENWNYNC